MAIDQQPMSRSITLPTTNINAGQGFNQLANATSQISQLVTQRINDVAIEQAAQQGEQDVAEGRQPERLALPFNKATKAYNNAVSKTEANRMIISAENLINESLTNNTNPANFNSSTPQKFKAEVEGIKSGLLQHARPENREYITESLDRMVNSANLRMLNHSIDYDNKKTNFEFQKDVSGLLEARRNAAIAGELDRLAGIDAALDQTLGNYSTMSKSIADKQTYFRADIEKHKQIDSVLAGYTDALHNGSTAKYLAGLADNKEKLPYNVWQEAVKGVVTLDQEQKRLKNDLNAEQWAQVQLGITNGSIQNASDIMNYEDLTVPQQLTAMKQLDVLQAKNVVQNSKLITAQQNILSGRPDWNTADTKNKMFEAQIQTLEKQTNNPATLVDMAQSVLGQSDFPASGLPSTPMGTNVPAFDSVMSGKLTSKDPIATAQAGMVYNDMVNVQQQPNSVSLSGDALAVATLFNELNKGGTPPDQAAQQAIDVVLNAKEPEIAQRIERFHRTLEKIDPRTGQNALAGKFKEVFGQAPQAFVSDEAFRLFQDTYRANYIQSNSEQAAFNATKYSMRAWGTSKYFDKGYVGQPVPEKELPIANVGNALPNQIASNIQGLINRTKAAREAHPDLNIPVIEWVDPKQTITGSESEKDKVFKNMSIGNHPRIKINGHETDVVLIPSATSRLGQGINYILGAYDQFNNLNPIKDLTNGVDQVARFAPQDLSLWAPGIATAQTDKELQDIAMRVQSKEIKIQDDKELKTLEDKNPPWQVILGLGGADEYRKYIEERAGRTDKGRLDKIIESLKGGNAKATRDDIVDADNVGISMDLEPRR